MNIERVNESNFNVCDGDFYFVDFVDFVNDHGVPYSYYN